MSIKCEEYSSICVVEVTGDLSGSTAALTRQRVSERLEQRRVTDFIVDLAHCRFIDSVGLEALLWIKRRVEDVLGQVKLVHADASIATILMMTRLDMRFECVGDLATALKTMR